MAIKPKLTFSAHAHAISNVRKTRQIIEWKVSSQEWQNQDEATKPRYYYNIHVKQFSYPLNKNRINKEFNFCWCSEAKYVSIQMH